MLWLCLSPDYNQLVFLFDILYMFRLSYRLYHCHYDDPLYGMVMTDVLVSLTYRQPANGSHMAYDCCSLDSQQHLLVMNVVAAVAVAAAAANVDDDGNR